MDRAQNKIQSFPDQRRSDNRRKCVCKDQRISGGMMLGNIDFTALADQQTEEI